MDRQLNLKIKSVDETGRVEGYASVYGNKDLNGDIIERGAFTKTLGENGGQVPLLWQHHTDIPIGLASLFDESHGLKMDAQIELAVTDGREAHLKASKGLVKGLSIGYRVVKEMWDDTARAFRLMEIKLLEVSLVTIPANPLTLITSVKNDDRIRNIAAAFDEMKAGRTLSGATRKRIEQTVSELQALLAEADAAAAEDDEPLKHSIDRLIATLRA